VGLTGDESREGLGEFAADDARLVGNFFVDVDESRTGLDVVEGAWSLAVTAVVSLGSAVSCVAPVMEVKGLSSMVVAVFPGLRKMECFWGRTLIAQPRTNGRESRIPYLGLPPVLRCRMNN
jgi:hypothetical protein